MAQVGHHALSDTIALARHASEHGIEFGIAMNPYFPPDLPDALVVAYYRALDEATDLPLFLFNTPYSGAALSVEAIGELHASPAHLRNRSASRHVTRHAQA